MRRAIQLVMGVLGAGGVPLLSDYLSALILAESAGGVYWPLDDTGAFARAVNPALALGRNIVINGDFASDTIWSKGGGITIAGGVLSYAGVNNTASQSIGNMVIGKSYEVTYTVLNYVSGSVRVRCGSGSTATSRSANGTYTETMVCAGSNNLLIDSATTFTGDIDNVTVKQVNILASSAYPSAELLVDGNMEAAGTAAWTAVNSATLTKETTSPHGGARVLRVTRNGFTFAAASQTILTLGKTYRITGYVRSDGTAIARVTTMTGTALFTSTNSTAWQSFDIQHVATTTGLTFGSTTAVDGQYVEFDDVSVTEVNPLTGVVSGATVNQDSGNPRIGKCYSFDGVNDLVNMYSADLNSDFNPSAGTIRLPIKKTAHDTTKRQLIILRADGNNLVDIYFDTTAGRLVYRYVAGGTSKTVTVTGITSTDWMMPELTWDVGADQMIAYLNGVQQGSTQTGLGVWVGNLATTTCCVGASSTSGGDPHNGLIAHPLILARAATAQEALTAARNAGVA